MKAFEWENPHSEIDLAVVRTNGAVEEWKFEGSGMTVLRNPAGRKAMMKVGDKITVEYYPMRQGLGGGMFVSVTLADGKAYPVGVFVPGSVLC